MTSRRSALRVLSAGIVAAGGTWGLARARGRQAEAMFPPSGRLIEVDGVAVHYVRKGAGPEVVLIHGASGNLRDFTFGFMDRLARRYTVTAFDRPGLGYTDPLPRGEGMARGSASPVAQARLLRAAADRLGIAAPVVVGHSFGGIVALGWAIADLDHGTKAAASAVVALAGVSMPWPGALGPYYRINGSPLGAVTIPLLSAFVPARLVRDRIAATFKPQDPPDGYEAHIGARLVLRPDSFRANIRQVSALRPHVVAMERRYGGLSIPIEMVHGTADETVPIQIHARPFARRYGAELTELPGVGHMPHHVAPAACEAAIDRAARRSR